MPLTVGMAGGNQLIANLDTVLTLAFANSGDAIFDNISKNNAFWHEIKKNGTYKSVSQPFPYIDVPLMYALGKAEWYEGWDVLNTQPTEGITEALYPWRQLACPAGYNRRESRITSQTKLKELATVKIEQAQLSMVEAFNTAFLQGNVLSPGGTLQQPMVSVSTGRSGIEPLPELVAYAAGVLFGNPTATLQVGGLDQATRVWWRNWTHDLTTIITYAGLLSAFDRMYQLCTRGPGGGPDLIITDEITRSLLNSAYYAQYFRSLPTDNDYPFDNLKFRGAHVVCEELVPNVHAGTIDTSGTGLGTAYFLNTKFFNVKYDSQCNFILTDLQKPVNQDGKIGHVLWMGNAIMNNRRKHGVIGNIARVMT